jgi:hypothetical protein
MWGAARRALAPPSLSLALGAAALACGPAAPASVLTPTPTARPAPPARPPRWTSTGPTSRVGPELAGGRMLLVGSRPALVRASPDGAAFVSDREGAPLVALGSALTKSGAREAIAHDGRTIVRIDSGLERRVLATLDAPIESLGSLAGEALVWTRGARAPVRVALDGEGARGALELPGAPPLLALELATPSTGVALFALAGLAITRDGGKTFAPLSPPVGAHVVTGLEVRSRGLFAESFGTLEAPIELATARLGAFAERAPEGPDPTVTFVSTTRADPLALACERGLPAAEGTALVASAGLVALVELTTGRVTRATALRRDLERQPCWVAPWTEGAAVVACSGRRDDDDDAFGVHVVELATLRERSRVDGLGSPTPLRASASGAALALAPQGGDWKHRRVLAGGKAHVVMLDDATSAGALRSGEALSVSLTTEGSSTHLVVRRHGASQVTVVAERTLDAPGVVLDAPPSEGDDGVTRFALRTPRGLELGRVGAEGLELVAYDGLAAAHVRGARALALTRESEGRATVVWIEEGRPPRPLGEGHASEPLALSAVGARVGDHLLVGSGEPGPWPSGGHAPPKPASSAPLAPTLACDDVAPAPTGPTSARARTAHPGTAAWLVAGARGGELTWLDLRVDERARRAAQGGVTLGGGEQLAAVVLGDALVVVDRSEGASRLVRARAGRKAELLVVDAAPALAELSLGAQGAVAWADERTLSLWPSSGPPRALHPAQTLGRLTLAGLDDHGALLLEPYPERGVARRLRFPATPTPLPLDGWSSNQSLAERAEPPPCGPTSRGLRASLEQGHDTVRLVRLGASVTPGRVVRDVELDARHEACLRATWLWLLERPRGWDALVLEPDVGARAAGHAVRARLISYREPGRALTRTIACTTQGGSR